MPTYVYQPDSDESCRYCMNCFEKRQKISAPRLTACPECGSPVRRVISAPNLAINSVDTSEKNIADKGFTQYRKLEKGLYEKTAGKGPNIIKNK